MNDKDAAKNPRASLVKFCFHINTTKIFHHWLSCSLWGTNEVSRAIFDLIEAKDFVLCQCANDGPDLPSEMSINHNADFLLFSYIILTYWNNVYIYISTVKDIESVD